MKDETGLFYGAIASLGAAVCLVCVSFWDGAKNDRTFMDDLTVGNIFLDKINVEVNGTCAGTVISTEHRLVLTAYHCVENDLTKKNIMIEQRGGEWIGEKTNTARVVAFDRVTDMAVVQVNSGEDNDIPMDVAAPLLPEEDWTKIQRGQSAWVIGNPLNEYGYLTHGVIGKVTFGQGVMSKLNSWQFQYTGGVINGNSGGALLDDDGRVIGVVSYTFQRWTMRGQMPTDDTYAVPHMGGATSVHYVYKLLRDNNLTL